MFNLVQLFKDEASFYLLSRTREIDGTKPALPLKSGEWISGMHGEQIYYANNISPLLVIQLIRQVAPDVIYINGLFNISTTLGGILGGIFIGKKVIIAPRGMLIAWGLKKNAFLKRRYLYLLKLLIGRGYWHATDEEEMKEIEVNFGKRQTIYVATNISRTPNTVKEVPFPARDGKIHLVFLSLITRKKNLHVLIDAVNDAPDFCLDIYGPAIDEEYWQFCQRRITDKTRISYKGPLVPWVVPSRIQDYHFLVLPTQGENFGHAIFDALSNGVPVITSLNTPWKDLDVANAGFYLKDINNSTKLVELLKMIAKSNNYATYRKGSLVYAANYYQERNYRAAYSFLLD